MRLGWLFAALIALWGCAQAFGFFEPNTYRVDGARMFVSGEITPRTPDSFVALIEANPQVQTIVLMDMPGSVDEDAVHDLGYFIREAGLDTHLTPQSAIYSGAVDLFIAGNRRTMVCCAEIGVHDWADGYGDGSDYPAEAWEHDANVAYFQTMLGSDAFYWFTLQAAPSGQIHLMTPSELGRFGILTR
jgi:hypothetical protein